MNNMTLIEKLNNTQDKLNKVRSKMSHYEKENLLLKSKLQKANLEISLMRKNLKPYQYVELSEDNINIVKLREIIESKFMVNISERNREVNVTYPRHLFYFWLCNNTKLSLKKIGEIFGNHHSTIIHSRNLIHDLMSYDKSVVKDYDYICSAMKRTYFEHEIVITPS